MDVVIERCAGIDIGKKTMAVTIRAPGAGKRRRQETRTFSTMTADVLALRDWLVAEHVAVAGMEATGDYWKPVFYLLEDAVECWLLNAHHLKVVPGRKTSRTRSGSPNWSNTGWSDPRSCRPRRSANCGT